MKKFLFLGLLLFLFSCESKDAPSVSFYYWKTFFKLTSKEQQVVQTNEVQKLYVRYFDVKLESGKPFPVAPIHFDTAKPKIEIIPVVFIKNEVFLDKRLDVQDLAMKIVRLVDQINAKNRIENHEIQIDCDWSLQSRDLFMRFLHQLKKQYPKTISATIRLHQVKYFKETKIPPVDYGVLMFYNMGELKAEEGNSIYDKSIAERYLPSLKKYPLDLKVALPVFSWIVHSRNGQIVNLIAKIDASEFQNNATFEWKENKAVLKDDVITKGFFFKKGDQLKIEAIQEEDLEEMVDLLRKYMPKKPKEIIYYDLDQNNFNKLTNDTFFKTCNADF
ncbi:hypothetical protein [Flavobacterium sp. GCM10027622]|uniref:hypothetical protein n=1 Tax=unclassified Flavobacterium TaxID=196869 RepID=UPI00361C74F5